VTISNTKGRIVAYRFAWKHKQTEKNSDSTDYRSCKCCNTNEQKAVDCSLQERVARIDTDTESFGDARHLEMKHKGRE
jgi:hypothetical protein